MVLCHQVDIITSYTDTIRKIKKLIDQELPELNVPGQITLLTQGNV